MVHKIDFGFIGKLEGKGKLDGYVPDAEGSKSGVTIATGIDIGQMNAQSLAAFPITEVLRDKLRPYLGKIKQDAVQALAQQPLRITEEEAEELDVTKFRTQKQVAAAAGISPVSKLDGEIRVRGLFMQIRNAGNQTCLRGARNALTCKAAKYPDAAATSLHEHGVERSARHHDTQDII